MSTPRSRLPVTPAAPLGRAHRSRRAAPGPAPKLRRANRSPSRSPERRTSARAQALGHIALPDEALPRASATPGKPGSSLGMISDQGLGNETGRGTDFIVVASSLPYRLPLASIARSSGKRPPLATMLLHPRLPPARPMP